MGRVRRLRSLPGVLETETMLEMQVHKFAYRDLAARRPGRRLTGREAVYARRP